MPTAGRAIRESQAFPLDPDLVHQCHLKNRIDQIFRRAVDTSLDQIPRDLRSGALSGVTGHVAESVVELVFDELGYHALWDFPGPGRHGIDLLMLAPDGDMVIAIEVKGTLRARRWPRLSRREIDQMSAEWVDKADNPGMSNWDLQSADVYGA